MLAKEDQTSETDCVHEALVTRRDILIVTGVSLAAAGLCAGLTERAYGQDAEFIAEPITTRLTVNGTYHVLQIDPRQSILDVLRERLELTGTKKGCNQGACGACTILLEGKRINSCLTIAAMHDGATVTTIEGIKDGDDLHRLQSAFIENEGFQCGYCTSGQIMSGLGCIAEGHARDVDQIRHWMSGNICRCGAYPGICAAIHAAGQDA